jgi:hypothetical protein
LLSGRYPSSFPSTRSANFAAADSSNSQIASTDPSASGRLHQQELDQVKELKYYSIKELDQVEELKYNKIDGIGKARPASSTTSTEDHAREDVGWSLGSTSTSHEYVHRWFIGVTTQDFIKFWGKFFHFCFA